MSYYLPLSSYLPLDMIPMATRILVSQIILITKISCYKFCPKESVAICTVISTESLLDKAQTPYIQVLNS